MRLLHDRLRRPSRRSVNRAAMCSDRYYVGKLASRRKVAGNVPAVCCMESKVCRALTWIEHDCLPLELMTHKVKRSYEVRIARDDDKCISGVCVGIAEKRCGEIDIRSFLFDLYHMYKSIRRSGTFLASGIYRWNPGLVLVVVAFNYIHAAMCVYGLKVNVLAFDGCLIMWISFGPGCEVLDGHKFMIRVKLGMHEHCTNKPCEVKPLESRKSTQQSVVEIASVNVGYGLHLLSIKIGPQTLRSKTLFRVGRALRLDMNPFKGSSTLYQIPQTATRG